MSEPHPVVLYDGSCGFCAGWVQWVLRHDTGGRFRFAALGSDAARSLLGHHGLPPDLGDSVVLVLPGEAPRFRSDAALGIAEALGGVWRVAALARLVPRSIRDRVYAWIGERRHRLAPPACVLPTPEQRARFLDRVS